MKKGTESLLKFRLLMRELSLASWEAMGLLVALWRVTEESCPRGDLGRYDDDAIALAIGWERTDGATLVAALVRCRWLDELPGEGRLYVHDWHEHAEDRVQMRVARSHQWFANGAIPKLTKFSGSEKEALTAFYAKSCDSRAPGVPLSESHRSTTVTDTGNLLGGTGRNTQEVKNHSPRQLPYEAGGTGRKFFDEDIGEPGGQANAAATAPNRVDHERNAASATTEPPTPPPMREIAYAEVVEDAKKVARGLPPRKIEDRSLVLKCLWLLRRGELSEKWFWSAFDDTVRRRPSKPWAYFTRALQSGAATEGVPSLNRLLATVRLPSDWPVEPAPQKTRPPPNVQAPDTS